MLRPSREEGAVDAQSALVGSPGRGHRVRRNARLGDTSTSVGRTRTPPVMIGWAEGSLERKEDSKRRTSPRLSGGAPPAESAMASTRLPSAPI